MKNHKRFSSMAMCTLVAAALTATVAQAALLNVSVAAPVINYDSNGNLNFDAGTGKFDVDATPLAVTFADSSFAFVDAPRALRIRLLVDGAGVASSNGIVDDLVIEGSIDVDGNTVPEYSGTLLTGKIQSFGFLDTGTVTDTYDYLFSVTGGSMASLFVGGQIGVTMTSERSSFAGSFLANFSGGAKGDVGLVPCQKQAITGYVTCPTTGSGVENATVTAYDAADQVVGSDTTAADGSYSIDGLTAPGSYTVTLTVPANSVSCSVTSTVVGLACDKGATADFCLCPCLPTSIKGNVVCDRGGQQAPQQGVTVTVYDSTNSVAGSAVTLADGSYSVGGLVAGAYTVTVTPLPNTKLCGEASANVTLACNEDGTANFCLCPCLGSAITGIVICNIGAAPVPQADIKVTAYDVNLVEVGSATTAADGTYSIPNLPPGTYTVTVTVPDKFEACDATTKTVTLVCEENGVADFCLCPPPSDCDTRISGKVKCPGKCWSIPVQGATITVVDQANQVVATKVTGADGLYSISGLPAGTYTVKLTLPNGYTACGDTSASVTLVCGSCKSVYFCACPTCDPGTVTGTIKCSSTGVPVEGVTVKAFDGYTLKGTATTGPDGKYTITDLPAGKSYTVKITVPPGYSACGSTYSCVTLSCGQTKTIGFCVCPPCKPGPLTGTIKCSATGSPISGVTVKVYDGSNTQKGSYTTGDDGKYTFENLNAGKYTVKIAVPTGFSACGSTSTCVTLYCGQSKTVDFCACPACPPATIKGTIKCTSSCKTISGVVVKVYDAGNVLKGTATTGTDGKYSFPNLAAGKYTVKITAPSGYCACNSTTSSCATLSCGQIKCLDFCVCKKW